MSLREIVNSAADNVSKFIKEVPEHVSVSRLFFNYYTQSYSKLDPSSFKYRAASNIVLHAAPPVIGGLATGITGVAYGACISGTSLWVQCGHFIIKYCKYYPQSEDISIKLSRLNGVRR